ncbi:MAG: hypothetical protein ABI972_04320 [Acidobacteriota bacterium]
MPVLLLAALLLQAAPFWELRPPAQWSQSEVDQLLSDSPWAQNAGIRVYLASAEPVRQAELLWKKWRKQQLGAEGDFEDDVDYEEFLRQHPGDYIVVGVYGIDPTVTPDPRDVAKMQKDSRIKLDKRKYAMLAYFPPTPADPILRMVFPKKVLGDEKNLILELYLPGVHLPYRNFEFPIKSLLWQGKPAL